MDPPTYTILRIKRKATDSPLSSLVIQEDDSPRIKKRRSIPILPKARGVFRLAETVPEGWEGRGKEGEVLKGRIQALLAAAREDETERQDAIRQENLERKELEEKEKVQAEVKKEGATRALQYRVVPPTSPRTRAMMPPKVLSLEEERAAAEAAALNLIDAEAVQSGSSAGPSRRSTKEDEQQEKEVAAFLPMLEEYLRLDAIKRPSRDGETERYVYDLYYRDLRPSFSSIPLGPGVGDGVSIGALIGYNDSSPTSTPSDSEPEDEADENSNDEDYYRNDYPEDEDGDEDMHGYRDAFGSDSGSGTDEGGGEGGSDGGGGEWDYR